MSLDYILIFVFPPLATTEWGREAETFYYIPFLVCFEFFNYVDIPYSQN